MSDVIALRHRSQIPLLLALALAAPVFAAQPSEYEQYLLELVNRARLDPAGEVSLLSDPNFWDGAPDLNEGLEPGTISATPKQPLAFHPLLIDAAQGHSQWMIDNDTFSHYSPGGADPGDRMAAAGYPFTPPWGWGENIAYQGTTGTPDVQTFLDLIHGNLFGDAGIDGRGHRINLMNEAFQQVGVGVVLGVYSANGKSYNTVMATQDFAYNASGPLVTGVAYDDVDSDGFYTPAGSEAVGGLTVEVLSPGSETVVASSVTFASGGYTVEVPPGIYDLRFWGQGRLERLNDVDLSAGLSVKVDAVDLGALIAGDANLDGQTDDADYTVWADQYGSSGAAWTDGDFNGDGAVDDADYTLWADHYGLSGNTPEPATLAMLGISFGLIRRSRRRLQGCSRL